MKNCMLIIMDGYALREQTQGNAIAAARTPNLDRLTASYPSTTLACSGLAVGLPDGQMGNSEVGHLNIGAGRTVFQDITRIDEAVASGEFNTNPAFNAAIDNALANGTCLHLMGLLSDGGVHSTVHHLYALLNLARMRGMPSERVFVHCFMDGRDVSPTSGASFIRGLQAFMDGQSFARIATVMGRYYIMDRDNRWERVEQGYNCMTAGTGATATDAAQAVEDSYEQGITDEFIKPFAVTDADGKPVGTIKSGDSVIFFNFRSDRAREVTRAFISRDFDAFKRANGYTNVFYVGMTQYDETFKGLRTAFAPQNLTDTLGAYLAHCGKTQLRIAETEKYAHVTFFFNGGEEAPNAGEDRLLVQSPKVATYDLQPEMSAVEVTDRVVEQIRAAKYDVIILNFANCDMVGHTGVMDAAIKAVETVDACIARIEREIAAAGGCIFITADHGNAEVMTNPDGSVNTAHTTNPVPLIYVNNADKHASLSDGGRLCDIAPTMLYVLGLPQPALMTGKSLINR